MILRFCLMISFIGFYSKQLSICESWNGSFRARNCALLYRFSFKSSLKLNRSKSLFLVSHRDSRFLDLQLSWMVIQRSLAGSIDVQLLFTKMSTYRHKDHTRSYRSRFLAWKYLPLIYCFCCGPSSWTIVGHFEVL